MTTWFAQNSSVDIDSTNEWNDAAGGGGAWLTWASLGAADILVANGKTGIVVNVDVTCATITNSNTYGGTAGGSMSISATGITLAADIYGASGWFITSTVTGELTVVGNVEGGPTGVGFTIAINHTGTGDLLITGDITSGIGNGNQYGYGVQITNGSLTIVGDVTSTKWPAVKATAGVIVSAGDCFGGTGGSSTVSDASAFWLSGTASLAVTGNVYGGNVLGSSAGIHVESGTVVVEITGNCIAQTDVAVRADDTSTIIINGNETAFTSGTVAVLATRKLIHVSNELTHEYRTDNSGAPGPARSLYTGGTNLGQPVEADVRYATTFGASTEYTGSLRVPDPAYVNAGVLTDATVGTMSASLDATALRTALGMGSANLDTQIATLATPTNITAATGIVLAGVEHTGAIIPTVSTVTDGAKSLTALSTVTWTPTIAGYIDVAVSSRNAVTPPTVTEFNARTILAAAYFDPAVDTVARVTLVDTTTTNTDMRGTDGANTTAPATPANVSAVTTTLAALLPVALVGGRIDASVGAVATDAINAAAIAADAVTEIQDGLATQTSLDAKLTAARLGVLTSLESMIVTNVYTADSMANVALAAGGDATVANQDLLLARLATGPIRITSTVTAGGVVNLRVGDDYVGTRIAITFDDAGGTIMTYMQSASVASVIFGAGRNTEINEIYGTVDPDDGVYDSGAGTSTVYPQIARADITGPVSDDYGYQIKAIDTAGRHITKIAGSVVVLAKNAFPV